MHPCQLPVRERSCENQGIGDRNDNQNTKMKQMLFRSKVRVIRKCTERIDCRMDDDAGKQAAGPVKNRDQQEADRDGKDDLTQIADQIHAAAIEQVDNMSDAEGQAGNDDGRSHIILCNGGKQKPSEDHFLQKSNAEHTHDPTGRFSR